MFVLKALGLAFALAILVLSSISAVAGNNSISLLSVTNAPAAQPTFGSTVSFAVTTSAKQPWVEVLCWQGGTATNYPSGTVVYDEWHAYFGTGSRGFTLTDLASNVNHYGWSSGGANCVARLWTVGTIQLKTLAYTTFVVSP